jgi:excinuclease UvrABC ATPase subunit
LPGDGSPIERSRHPDHGHHPDWPEETRIEVLAPLVRGRKGEFRDLFEDVQKRGFVRVRVDGETYDVNDVPTLNRRQNHDVAVVVDRLVVRPADRGRLADSIETALKVADGMVEVMRHAARGGRPVPVPSRSASPAPPAACRCPSWSRGSSRSTPPSAPAASVTASGCGAR